MNKIIPMHCIAEIIKKRVSIISLCFAEIIKKSQTSTRTSKKYQNSQSVNLKKATQNLETEAPDSDFQIILKEI